MGDGHRKATLKEFCRSKMLALALRMILGAVFLFAGIDKILHPAAFAEVIYNYQILPDGFINLSAILLPWIETLIGLSLVSGIWIPGATLLSATLLSVFLGAILFNLARGLDVDCGCFMAADGAGSSTSILWYVARDGLLLLIALYLLMPALPLKRR
ncbi:MAG: DoxX family membrane protein [Proteobacteria bacterium]|nr:DoxX family membrane protein [Pseudomonadota bacterium]